MCQQTRFNYVSRINPAHNDEVLILKQYRGKFKNFYFKPRNDFFERRELDVKHI